jgi:hypothetical protein
MPKTKKPLRPAAGDETRGRVQVPAMYLHPDTLKFIDGIKDEMRVNRGIAVDEAIRRFQTLRDSYDRLLSHFQNAKKEPKVSGNLVPA